MKIVDEWCLCKGSIIIINFDTQPILYNSLHIILKKLAENSNSASEISVNEGRMFKIKKNLQNM